MPPNAQTWQNMHLNPIYTRGIGVVVDTGGEKQRATPSTGCGDVHPVQRTRPRRRLELREPSIFFGETMADYASSARRFVRRHRRGVEGGRCRCRGWPRA
jgi:uncharacterized membrane protein (UPF0182 family)